MEQQRTSTEEVRVSRPEIPESYGIPRGEEGMLPWSHVGERMSVARSYWLVTVRPDGRPHSVPVWGVWVEESLHFGGGRSTRKARNLVANPNVVAHSESGEDVVILEGVAEEVTDPVLQERIDDAYEAKYRIRHGTPVRVLKPRVVHAWSRFPADATRWLFRQSRSEKGTTVSKEEAMTLGKSKQSYRKGVNDAESVCRTNAYERVGQMS
jgi:hypothetical protein